jgi:hypothetical protein
MHAVWSQPTDLLLTRYALERLLHSLGLSPHRERFVLKGATVSFQGRLGLSLIRSPQGWQVSFYQLIANRPAPG